MLLQYVNTQIHKRWCEGFFAAVLLCIRFVKKALLLRGYTDMDYKMTISYLCIRFFICGTSKPSTWNFYPSLFETCLNTQTPKDCSIPIRKLQKNVFLRKTSIIFVGPSQPLLPSAVVSTPPPPSHFCLHLRCCYTVAMSIPSSYDFLDLPDLSSGFLVDMDFGAEFGFGVNVVSFESDSNISSIGSGSYNYDGVTCEFSDEGSVGRQQRRRRLRQKHRPS